MGRTTIVRGPVVRAPRRATRFRRFRQAWHLGTSSSQPTEWKRVVNFISMFSGAGGLDRGLEAAGFACRYASDHDPVAIETLRADARHEDERPKVLADVRRLTGRDILKTAGLRVGEAPLMAGGPPCQSWSSAGRQRGLNDPRGQLFRDFVRLADECGARIILFENVRGMLTARGPEGEPGGALHLIRQTLLQRGYASRVELLNAADYGVPQRRVRLFIVGFRGVSPPVFPVPTHQDPSREQSLYPGTLLKPWVPMSSCVIPEHKLTSDEHIRPSPKMAKRLEGICPGNGIKSPGKRETTRPGGHWGYMQGGFVADTGRPSRTITASSQQDWIQLNDGSHRRLTPKECAALQTFPSGWTPKGGRAAQYRQIGNAVPPKIAEIIGSVLRQMLTEEPRNDARSNFEGESLALPPHLQAHVRYTKSEHARNGESRRASSSGASLVRELQPN